jgi:uncharacterized short protein YbdD (DUF466 family)
MRLRDMTFGDGAAVGVSSRAPRPTAVLSWLRGVARVVRTIVGAPDYDRYVTHMRDHHPECEPLSRDEFMHQRLESRYSRPGARCC